MPVAHDINRILVRGTRWIGDAVMSVPALRALRQAFPRAHITLAAGAWARDLFLDADFIDDLLTIETRNMNRLHAAWHEARAWRAGDFDLVLLLQNAFAAALTARLAGITRRAGYGTDGRAFLLTEAFPVPAWRASRHEVFYYLNLVAELERRFTGASVHAATEPDQRLSVSEARREEARRLLRRAGAEATTERPLIVFCPGSTNSRAKRWEAGSFAALADRFMEEMNAHVAFVGARQERDVSERVASLMRNSPLMLTGETTLAESIAVIDSASLVVSNDTGPAHIAGALGRPTLVIFGPTNPMTTRPFSSSAEVIREPPACAPCMLRDCPVDHRCMTRITPDAVFARATRLLSAPALERSDASLEVTV